MNNEHKEKQLSSIASSSRNYKSQVDKNSYNSNSSYESVSSRETELEYTPFDVRQIRSVEFRGTNYKQDKSKLHTAYFDEIILLGSGSFADVFKASSIVKSNGMIPKQEKAFKVFQLSTNPKKAKEQTAMIWDEYNLTKKIKYLGMRRRIKIGNIRILPMNFLPGENFYNILADHQQNIKRLDTQTLLDITRELLVSYSEHIYQNKLIHKDLKPENIQVDLEHMKVYYFDFGFAQRVKDNDKRVVGTYDFMAPEIILIEKSTRKNKRYTPACDIYALGKILMSVWCLQFNMDLSLYYETINYLNITPMASQLDEEILNAKFMPQYKDLNFIKTLITNMVRFDRDKRWGIEQALSFFDENHKKLTVEMESGRAFSSAASSSSSQVSNTSATKLRTVDVANRVSNTHSLFRSDRCAIDQLFGGVDSAFAGHLNARLKGAHEKPFQENAPSNSEQASTVGHQFFRPQRFVATLPIIPELYSALP